MNIGKLISNRLDEIITPVRNEVRFAQEQAIERIQNVFFNAEKEVARDGQFMTPEQRMQTAENEFKKAEEQLLLALGSMFKAVCYIAPQISPFIPNPPIKEVKGIVVDQIEYEPQKPKRRLFGRKGV